MTDFLQLPFGYWLACATLAVLMLEAALRWKTSWAIPAGMVYVTIFGWYILEPIYTPESMEGFSSNSIDATFISVFIFLLSFRLLATLLVGLLAPTVKSTVSAADLPADPLFWLSLLLSLALLSFGASRAGGDVLGSLFPIGSRSGGNMWGRAAGADAGTFGFFVSICGYLYTLVLAVFGMVLPLLKTRRVQVFCVIVILIAWPYAFLQGSRNIAIAVFVPFVFSFMFFSNVRKINKAIFLVASAVFIERAMREIINYRNVGFETDQAVVDTGHLGLNMASELTYCIEFINSGVIRQKWGLDFMSQVANVIPRFLWADKPLAGIDYAIARGFAGGESDIGVVATISTGVIGQGVLDFGPYFGPMFMAALMALWTAFLARLWSQGTVARACLFLVGMGLTFNLGRNVTLLVLWPMVFAYVLVLALEKFGSRKKRKASSVSGALLSIDVR